MSLAEGTTQSYTLFYPPCIDLAIVVYPAYGRSTLLASEQYPQPSNYQYSWIETGAGSEPRWLGLCCSSSSFKSNSELYLSVVALTDLKYELVIYDLSLPLPATHFYRYGNGDHGLAFLITIAGT